MIAASEHLGRIVLEALRTLGQYGLLILRVCRDAVRPPFYPRLIVEQVYQIGVRSMDLVFITALATGMVMSLQFGLGLEKFGGKPYVPKIISLSILRELGPVFTCLMLAARVGAGIASELGAMVVSQQVDAIRALGTSPLKRLVIPRIVGALIAIPTLAVFANLIGLVGAGLVGVFELDLEFGFFYLKVVETVSLTDLLTGLAKTFIFAFCISSVACFYGLNVGPGTAGVGQATTRAVVTSMVLILVTNFFLTKVLFYLFLVNT